MQSSFESRSGGRSRRFPACAPAAAFLLASAFAAPAHAFIYTVGKSGLSNNCSFPTLQQALTAAARSPGPDEIWVTRDVSGGYYQNQALVSPAQDVKIVGGFDDCRDTSPSGMTELHGNGGAAAPVLTINGGIVTIEKLRFTRGDATGSATTAGGGIRFAGNGTLNITDSLIDRNTAGMGGGIALLAQSGSIGLNIATTRIAENHANSVGGAIALMSSAGTAAFTAWDDVEISANFAVEGGGGIAMNPQSMLVMNGRNLRVVSNRTGGDGGALLAVSPVVIHLSPRPDAVANASFASNEARNGGVLALTDHARLGASYGRAVVTMTSEDAAHPYWMASNRARERGAVVYVRRPQAPQNDDDVSDVCAWNASYFDNRADVSGSVVALDGPGARYRNSASCAVAQYTCSQGEFCNDVDSNFTLPGGLPAEEGALYEARNGARMSLDKLRIRSNWVRSVFRVGHDDGYPAASLSASQALIVENTIASVLEQREGSYFDLVSATIARNDVSSRVFTNGTFNFFLRDSIVDQPQVYLFATDPLQFGGTPISTLLYSGIYFGTGDSLVFGRPQFTTDFTYRLMPGSPGVDFAAYSGGTDVYGRTRTLDITAQPDRYGPRDLGAVEMQAAEAGAAAAADF